jgi:hypothetical protein
MAALLAPAARCLTRRRLDLGSGEVTLEDAGRTNSYAWTSMR